MDTHDNATDSVVIIARYGDFNPQTKLPTSRGVTHMEELALSIASFIDRERTVLLSSTAPYAVRCADMLRTNLGLALPGESHDVLRVDDLNPLMVTEALELVEQNARQQNVIVVTHHEHLTVHGLAGQYCAKHHMLEDFPSDVHFGKGDALYVHSCHLVRVVRYLSNSVNSKLYAGIAA
jgi:hypothetical protein